jgi:hypothetical protein
MADFNDPRNAREWQDGYEAGARARLTGAALTVASVDAALERQRHISPRRVPAEELAFLAYRAMFGGGFEAAYWDAEEVQE